MRDLSAGQESAEAIWVEEKTAEDRQGFRQPAKLRSQGVDGKIGGNNMLYHTNLLLNICPSWAHVDKENLRTPGLAEQRDLSPNSYNEATDCVVKTDNSEGFPVHSAILARVCPLLADILTGDNLSEGVESVSAAKAICD